jgi:hypothetical protein
MLRTVLWIAAACAAVLMALAASRMLNFDKPAPPAEPAAPVAAEPPPPQAPPPPAPEVKAAPPPVTPEEQQIQDDAAATGMTTVEPEAPVEPPTN